VRPGLPWLEEERHHQEGRYPLVQVLRYHTNIRRHLAQKRHQDNR
jgi:hypothetical protein